MDSLFLITRNIETTLFWCFDGQLFVIKNIHLLFAGRVYLTIIMKMLNAKKSHKSVLCKAVV